VVAKVSSSSGFSVRSASINWTRPQVAKFPKQKIVTPPVRSQQKVKLIDVPIINSILQGILE